MLQRKRVMKLEVKLFVNMDTQGNTYLAIEENKDCYIVDPGSVKMKKIIEYIKENDLNLKGILLTHGHFDHIIGIPTIIDYKKVPVYVGEKDADFLYDSTLSLSLLYDLDFRLSDKVEVIKLKEGDTACGFEVMETPGHTEGGVCYINKKEKFLFSGDTVMKMTYGRTDFPTGSISALRNSIKKIMELDEDITIYPGHGGHTDIKSNKVFHVFS